MQFVDHNAQFHSRANTDYSVLTLLFNLQGLISWQGGWSDLTYIIDGPRQEHELPKVQLSSIKKHRVSCFRNILWCHSMQLQFALWHTTITLENCRKTSECLDNIWVDFQASSTLIGQVFSHLSAHVGCIQVNALFHILFCQPPHAPCSSSRSCWTLLFSSWAWGQTYGSCSFTFKVTTVCFRNTKYVASININLPNVQHTNHIIICTVNSAYILMAHRSYELLLHHITYEAHT